MNRFLVGMGACVITLMSSGVFAQQSPWSLRLGVSHIIPESAPSQTTAGGVNASSGTNLSVNINYAFNENWVLDVLGALPFKHELELDGTEIGETKHLPPTVSIKYHFMPKSKFDVFVGAGLNYTLFFDERIDGADVELAPSFGLAGMFGVDYKLGDGWSIGLDARYIQIETEATVNGQVIGDVAINPWVISTSIGYRF